MSIQEFGALGEGIGSLLILITLIYLAVQNRQNQKLLLSQAFQARTDAATQQMSMYLLNPSLSEAVLNLRANEEITPLQSELVLVHSRIMLHNYENLHYQYSLGVVPHEKMEGARKNLKYRWKQRPWLLNAFIEGKAYMNESFASWLDEVLQEIEQEEEAV